ncbi:hypothetical protein AgCh_018040 [Apium graveolens]
MAKYMNKSNKTASEVSVMEGPQNPTSNLFVGVLTRAKTLALKKLGLFPADSLAPRDGGSFIQLRGRRLQRAVLGKKQKKKKCGPTRGARARAENQGGGGAENGSGQLGVEIREQVVSGSVGGNALPLQPNGREQQEVTPSSLPRNPNVITAPGSSPRPRNSTDNNGLVQNPVRRCHPSSQAELDALFAENVKRQQKYFMEK